MSTHTVTGITFFLLSVVSVFSAIDDANLKERLTGSAFERVLWNNFDIKKLGATDEQLHRVLMDIYREAEAKWPTLKPKTAEWKENKDMVSGVLACLPLCGDIPVKDFLLAYAASKEKEATTRTRALSSYLRIADAEESRAVLLRFLVGDDRMDLGGRFNIVSGVRPALEGANTIKQAAILESLYVALSKEENKCAFHVYDEVLCEFSSRYVNSYQRIVILKKQINAPALCKADDSVMPDLQEKLKLLMQNQHYSDNNTNLILFKSGVLNLSQPDMMKSNELNSTAKGVTQKKTKQISVFAGLGVVVTLTAATGLWFYCRKHTAQM